MDWETLNEIFKTYAPTLEAVDKLTGIFIGVGLFFLAYQANRIAKSNLELARQEKSNRKFQINTDEREIFRSVYQKISDSLALILREGRVSQEALALLWQARDRARLELPQDIQDYVEGLRLTAQKAFAIYESYLYPSQGDGLPVGEERSRKSGQHMELIQNLTDAQPHEHFSKYMKIDAE